MSTSITQTIYADNCQACGQEHLNIDLIPVKLGNKALSRVRVCLGCLVKANALNYDIHDDYKEAASLLIQTIQRKNNV